MNTLRKQPDSKTAAIPKTAILNENVLTFPWNVTPKGTEVPNPNAPLAAMQSTRIPIVKHCQTGKVGHLTKMAVATVTVTLSSKGQLSLPKELGDKDDLEASDVFRLERLAPGKYLIEKLQLPALPKARLLRSKDGFMVFRPPRGTPSMTMATVKKLEAETL